LKLPRKSLAIVEMYLCTWVWLPSTSTGLTKDHLPDRKLRRVGRLNAVSCTCFLSTFSWSHLNQSLPKKVLCC
jgi:hypothetical protein